MGFCICSVTTMSKNQTKRLCSQNKNRFCGKWEWGEYKNVKSLVKSFAFAFRGIAFCVRYERNMRIHITATVYVMLAVLCFYELTRTELCVLILTCAVVMGLEMLNTALEVLTDKASPEYSTLARVAKDTAAGAVLISAVAAIAIGYFLLWDMENIREIIEYFKANTFALIALVISLNLSGIFIFSGKERRKRGKKAKQRSGEKNER